MRKILSVLILLAAPAAAQLNPNPADAITSRSFLNLGTPPPGVLFYCPDCQATSPCTGGGTGAYAFRTISTWSCLIGGSGGFPLLAPDGSGTAPSYSFSTFADTGLYLSGGTTTSLKAHDGSGVNAIGRGVDLVGGASTGTAAGGQVRIFVTPAVSASGSSVNGYQAAATFAATGGSITIGGMDVTTPIGSLFAAADRVAGVADSSGADLEINAGKGTGTGAGGALRLQTAVPGGAGSTQNPLQTILLASGADGSTTVGGPTTSGTVGHVFLVARTFANLGTPGNGSFAYCSDCTIANPCAGAGTGALAKRLNGVWVCN